MKKFIWFCLGFFCLMGLLKVFSIIPFNRMSADDFSYGSTVLSQGFWQAQKAWYLSWSGRFVSTFLQTALGAALGASGKVYLYSLVTFSVFVWASFLFFRRFAGLTGKAALAASAAFFVVLYQITPNKMESFYWLSGSITYLWPVIFTLFALSAKGSFGTFVFAFLAGGGNEAFSLVALVSYFCLSVYFLLNARKLDVRWLSLFVGTLASFLFVFFSPGNALRAQGAASDPMNLFGAFAYSLSEGPVILYGLVSKSVVFLVPFGIVLSFIFSQGRQRKKQDTQTEIGKVFWALTLPILISVVYVFAAFKNLGRIPPDRSDITLAFVVLLAVVYVSFILSSFIGKFKLWVPAFAFFLFLSSFAVVSGLGADVYIAREYSSAFDKTIEQIKETKDKGGDYAVVDVLPESGLVPNAQIKGYDDHWINMSISEFFGLSGIIARQGGD